MANPLGTCYSKEVFSIETENKIKIVLEQGEDLRKSINAVLEKGGPLRQNISSHKINKDLVYEVRHKKQLLTKLLAHLIAELAYYDGEANSTEVTEETTAEMAEEFVNRLNIHRAKVHFMQDEIEYIKNIIEESKKFI